MRHVPVRLTIVGLAATAGVALSACAPMHPGAAAVVGGDRISVAALQAVVHRTLADPTYASGDGSDVAKVQRDQLTTLVTHQLIAAAATEQHVTVSEGEVGSALNNLQQQEGSKAKLDADAAAHGIAPADLHDYFYYGLLEQKLAPKITTPIVHAAHILVKDKATADQILAQVQADPSQFATIAKQQSIDTQSGAKGGDLGTAPSAEFVSPFADAVDSAKVGSYFVVQSQFGWHVVHLISRTTTTLGEIDAQAQQAQTQADQQQAQQIHSAVLSQYLGDVAKRIGGISVNPRYGSWDVSRASIVETAGGLSSPEASTAPSSQAPLPVG